MNDIISKDNQIKSKNFVTIYTIRMYLNGFIIGYVFRKEIYKNFYIHKNDNIIFDIIKKNKFSPIYNNYKKSAYISKITLRYKTRNYLFKKLNLYNNNQNYQHSYKTILFHKLPYLKKNVYIPNFFAIRLSFWTCICSTLCWHLNKRIDNIAISSTLSGLIASSVNKKFFRESTKVFIPNWFGCIISYAIFI
ncbi:shikimate dehydrogenase, putative [Plasmodium vinckei brucechwatti]|uniref:Shikimate dehydrogenase, putative n=1 Tax=Plasmodium vinckei brucechwatti TaxID=119398 RepID=A0A6V7SMC8_PLAVN|nr:shikimate dehydrogenase, putative [Plasmodium vinckei brucechwatti]